MWAGRDKIPPCPHLFRFYGGDDQTRTDYLYVANVSLYRVSYIPLIRPQEAEYGADNRI